eukprot:101491_1
MDDDEDEFDFDDGYDSPEKGEAGGGDIKDAKKTFANEERRNLQEAEVVQNQPYDEEHQVSGGSESSEEESLSDGDRTADEIRGEDKSQSPVLRTEKPVDPSQEFDTE